ncbi:MAG: hypothetical protein A2Y34_12430 [Spirochaetes bacterium GWC1_27_15]|nr:MAG: hypothetical protein A2Z98_05460 [Spirochaetes bacterium GWB1_27_13]OHD21773.1 MAG: hypothetical protein A2Y34_12430 [Spirochaetes bacterium GWC1_27_15]
MFIKDYINYEKNISTDFLKVENYEFEPDSLKELHQVDHSSIYLLFNIGHILQFKFENINIFCPPKNALFGRGELPEILFNNTQHYKYSILSLSPVYSNKIVQKILNAVDNKYRHIFSAAHFSFSFSLNIEILKLIEDIYKSAEGSMFNFSALEIEAQFLHLLSLILRTILFETYKHTKLTSSPITTYYLVLKSFFEDLVDFESSLEKYHLPIEEFKKIYNYLTKSNDANNFIKENFNL